MLNSERYSANTADECKRIPLLCGNRIEMSMGRPGEWGALGGNGAKKSGLDLLQKSKVSPMEWSRFGLV